MIFASDWRASYTISLSSFAIPIATRLGLRYVNHIELSEGRALLEARQLIRPELLGPAGLDLLLTS